MISPAKSMRIGAFTLLVSVALACTPAASTSPSRSAAASVPAATTEPAGSGSPAASASTTAGQLPTADQLETTDLQIGFSVTEVSQYAGALAQQLGYYEELGLNVEYSQFEGDARVADALQSGQIQIGFSGTSSAISSQLTDVPYDVVAVLAVVLTDDLVCQSAIQNAEHVATDPADGEPATIAISTFGGTSNAAALLALQALELSPQDAVITQIGGQDARLAALIGGSVDCAIIDSNMRADMQEQGFSIVVDLKEAEIPFGRSGMSVTTEFKDANPNTVLAATAAVLKAQNEIFTNNEGVLEQYIEFSDADEETARTRLEDFVEIGNQDLMWSDEAFTNAAKAIAMANPDIIEVEITDSFDRTFLDTLESIGYYEELGVPIEE